MAAPNAPKPCFQLWSWCVTARTVGEDGRAVLHDHQRKALKEILGFWRPGGRGTLPVPVQLPGVDGPVMLLPPCVISLPTGSGKSVIAAAAPYVLGAKRVLAICPDKETAKQLAAGLSNDAPLGEKAIVERGIVTLAEAQRQGGPLPSTLTGGKVRAATLTHDLGIHEMVITNAHKFASTARGGAAEPQWKELEDSFFDVVIVDEAHHFPASFWSRALRHFSDSKVIFLTATPYRSDGQLVLTGGGPAYHLSRADAVAGCVIRDVQSVHIDEDAADERVAWLTSIARVRELLAQQERDFPLPPGKDGKPQTHVAMACAWPKESADEIARLATASGLPAAAYHGDTPRKGQAMANFKSGRTRLLVICSMLLEGFDHPPVSVAAVMSNVTTDVKFSQFVGRAVRVVRQADGTVVGAPAYCVHHRFFTQAARFQRYISDRIIAAESTRAELKYAEANEEDGEEDEPANEVEREARAFELVANFDPSDAEEGDSNGPAEEKSTDEEAESEPEDHPGMSQHD